MHSAHRVEAENIAVSVTEMTARIAARVTRDLPAAHGEIAEMLDRTMVDSGLCCQEKVEKFIEESTGGHVISWAMKAIPAIKWKTVLPWSSNLRETREALKLEPSSETPRGTLREHL